MILSSTAHAADWFYVGDVEDGSKARLLGQSGSLSVQKNKNGVVVAGGTFVYVVNGEMQSPFWVGLNAQSCFQDGGEMVVSKAKDNVTKYWWSRNGVKMYDLMGKTICDAVETMLKNQDQPKDRKPGNESARTI